MHSLSAYSPENLRRYVMISYSWMMTGLVITFVVSFIMYQTGIFWTMLNTFPYLWIILAVAQIAIVIGFVFLADRVSAGTMKVMFIAYAVTLGITLTSIAYTYDVASISAAFLVSALFFAGLSILGMTTKKDLTRLGYICIVALIVLVLSQLLMMFLRVPMDIRFISVIGLLIFAGLTAWDAQRLQRMLLSSSGNEMAQEKIAIYMALELYLDFINIFLYLLQLFGNRR